MSKKPVDTWLTLKQAAEYTRFSVKTLRNDIKAKKLAAMWCEKGDHGPFYQIRLDVLNYYRQWRESPPGAFDEPYPLGNGGNFHPGTPEPKEIPSKTKDSVTLESSTLDTLLAKVSQDNSHLRDQLITENAFLRDQLKEKDKQLATAQTQLSAAQHQIEALTAMAGSFAALGTSLDHREQGKGTTHDLDPSTTTPTATAKEDPKPKEERGLLGWLIKIFTEPPTKPSA